MILIDCIIHLARTMKLASNGYFKCDTGRLNDKLFSLNYFFAHDNSRDFTLQVENVKIGESHPLFGIECKFELF